jgi:sulfite reductase (ferredoxin)
MSSHSVEDIKFQSRQLRGTIAETLKSDASHFSDDDYQLLKFHGSYQQDDRDERVPRKKAGLDKAWQFMVRTKQPGGDITASQYLALDQLAEQIANGTLRITTRQGIQFHGILKVSLKEAMQRIHESGLTTWGACGDVVRNTMGPGAPMDTPAHRAATLLAKQLSDTFLSKSTAYAEIWLNGEKLEQEAGKEVEDPIYGKYFLPRKFKIALAIPPSNDVDVYSNDLGFIAQTAADGTVEGYSVVVGGGFGMSHGQTKTYPALAKPLFFVKSEDVIDAAIAIVTTQRDYGDRTDRKHSRLKYLVDERGVDWFRAEVVSRMKNAPEPFRPARFTTVGDMMGWNEQGNGKLFVCIHVEMGRIKDADGRNYQTAFREIAKTFGFPIRLTPNANILFYDIDPSLKDQVNEILARHGVPQSEGFTEARKTAHACVALPTCGLALAESERAFPGWLDGIDAVLRELGLEKEPILFRMTGCPNGCARPYNADFAFVGRAPGKYAFFVGGAITGDRLAGLEAKVVPGDQIPQTVRPYLEKFKNDRLEGETFSEYWGRTHKNGEAPHPDQFHVELQERAARLAKEKEAATAVAE